MYFLRMAVGEDRCVLPLRSGGHALGRGGAVWEDALGAHAPGSACWLSGVSAEEGDEGGSKVEKAGRLLLLSPLAS